MKNIERIIYIFMLTVISLSNVATPVAYAAQIGKIHFDFRLGTPLDTSGLTKAPDFYIADHGSVLGASTTLFTVGSQKLDLQASNQGSAQERIPPRVEKLDKKVYETNEDVAINVVNPDNEAFTTTIQDASGKSVSVPITESNTGPTTTVDLAPSNEIKPGLYKVTITDEDHKSTQQDFTWGVLALNFDKSVYHPQDKADIAMAVLNDKGDMVCDADVTLQVWNPNNDEEDLTIKNSRVSVNPQCQKHDYSLQPDYESNYQFTQAGSYHFQLTAVTSNGSHTISDTIRVTDRIPFDLQRVSATRIYPPNTYPMYFNITANRDFSGTVTETVPDSFTITPATQSAAQSYSAMQTVYLNSNDPASVMSQQIASSSGGLVMPFHGNFPITQGFGAQLTDPTLQAFYTHYGLGGHDGIDFGLPMNTPLYAVDEGDVIWAGPGDYGTMVTIKHTWGQTYYGHMTRVSVTVGQHVTKDQLIGYSGMTGEATGPHLHFGMKPDNPDMTNGYYGKINPMPFLPIGQGESVAALGASSNPLANLVYNTTVLGASDSAATPTPTAQPSVSPTPSISAESSITPSPTAQPSVSPSATNAAQTAEVTPTPATVPVFTGSAASVTPDSNFSILDKEIKLNEQIANDALTQKVKVLTWNVNLKKGESTTLGYDYQTPKVSPQFYLLGPAKFYDDKARVVFQEERQWQIAADDVGVEWFQDTTGRQWNGYSWQYRKKIVIDHTKTSAGLYSNRPTVTFMEPGTDATEDFHLYQFEPNGTCTSDASVSETGPRSLLCTSGAGGSSSFVETPPNTLSDSGTRISMYMYLDSQPTGNLTFMQVKNNNSGGTSLFAVRVDKNQFLSVVSQTGPQLGNTAQKIQLNTWYRIGLSYTVGAAANIYSINLYVNGVQEVSFTCGGTCGTNLGTTGSNHLRFGWPAAGVGNNSSINFDDIYIDNGSDLGDPGDIHITNKRPSSNGSSVQFTTQIGSGNGSGYPGSCTWAGGCHAGQVNEQPYSSTNGVSVTTTTAKTEEYTVESASTGDVDLTKETLLADCGWVQASASATLNAVSDIIVQGTASSISINTGLSFEGCANTNTYPSGNTDVGVDGHYTSGSGTFSLYEAGLLFAYIPHTTAQFTPTSITPEFMYDGGDSTNTNGGQNFCTTAPCSTGNPGGFFADDFTGAGSSLTTDCTVSHTGPCSMEAVSAGSPGTKAYVDTGTALASGSATTTGRISMWIYFDSFPASGNVMGFLGVQSPGNVNSFTLRINGTSDKLDINPGGVGTTALSTKTWYRVSIGFSVKDTTHYHSIVYLNGHKEIDTVNTGTLGAATLDHYRIGNTDFVDNSTTDHIDDIYTDNGSDLSDTGDVRVTAKLPISDGASNGFGVNGSAAGTTCTSGNHCEYVNERPLNTSNNLSTSTANTRENFTLQSASQGDVDISNASMIAAEPWMYAKTGTACTGLLTGIGVDNVVSLGTSDTMFASASANANFLSGTQGVGIASCNSNQTVTLEEAGMMVAYTPNNSANTLTNFPVVFEDSSDADVGGHAQSSGNDIVFTDSTGRNLLNYEIESYSVSSGNATLWAWINIPSLSTTTDTIIYMYYGNPAAASQASASSVWDSNYTMVQHLEESAACAVTFTDSTSGAFNGSCNGSPTSGPAADASGQIGPARTFTGTSKQYISVPTDTKFNPDLSPFSVSMWIDPTSASTAQAPMAHMNTDLSTGWTTEIGNVGAGTCNAIGAICFYDGGSNQGIIDLSASTWQEITWVRSGTTVTIYKNGSSIGTLTGILPGIPSSTGVESIGADVNGVGGALPFDGSMDEVRYSQEALTPGWISTEYNDENAPTNGNFFNAVGSEETKIYAPTLDKLMRHGQWFDSTGTIQPFAF